MKKIIALTAVAAFAGIIVLGVLIQRPGRRAGLVYAMGGIPVSVVAYERTRGEFDNDLAAVSAAIDALEDIFSRHRAHSMVARLNAAGQGCFEGGSDELTDVLRRARRWYDMTGGAFDSTVGPLIELWKRAGDAGVMPRDDELAAARARVGMDHVHLQGGRICLDEDGIVIDLGAIAKGAILEHAAQVLRERGVPRGVVDAGGDVIAFGTGLFAIGIQDPRSERRGVLMGTMTLPAGAVVTSGGYERFVTIEGRRFSHIVDPRTGLPADELLSVTIVGPNATDADALATAISVMGRERGMELINRLDGFEALIVADDNIWCSPVLCELVEGPDSWRN